jgi:hypothetical protein
MSVGEFESPWLAAVRVAAAADGCGADAAGAVEDPAGLADAAWLADAAARGQCLAHSFGEAKLLRQKSRPRV